MHFLAGRKYIDVQWNYRPDRDMYSACQKFFAFLICLFQALICLFSGVYGDYEQIGVVNCILIVLQLCGAGILTILLDDLLQKGYGLGNGVSLFVASNIFANILWSCASFQSVKAPSGDLEYEGILIFLIHSIIRWRGFYDCLFRTYAPNLINLISTLIIGLIVNFTQVSKLKTLTNSNCGLYDDIFCRSFAGTLASALAPSATQILP